MKKFIKLRNMLWLLIVMAMFTHSEVMEAQSSGEHLFDDGQPHKVDYPGWEVRDFYIPQDVQYDYLYLHAEGADGGARIVKEAWGSIRHIVNGGSGASIKAIFKVGTGTGEIPPGSLIRMIVGGAGESRTSQASLAGGGGAGTAVLFKAPDKPYSDFQLLMVAGGGGGGMSDCCVVKFQGSSGETGTSGSSGNGNGHVYSGGSNGNGGDASEGDTDVGAGGGAFTAGGNGGMQSGGAGGGTDDPHGGRGGYKDHELFTADTYAEGGCGYGAGGQGSGTSGGGGGGYSGGGVVADKTYRGGGGGGGSYLNSDLAKDSYKVKNPTTSDPKDGFVQYQFLTSSQIFRQIKFAYNTNKCIDDNGSGTSDGTNIQSYSCNGTNAQKWFIHPTDRTIHSALDFNKCVDLDDSRTDNGTNIQLWDCNGAGAQHWVYNGLYKTIHSGVNSDKCFDAVNGSATTSNVNLQLWDCQYSNNNQKWEINGATTVSNVANKKHIVPVVATGFAFHSQSGAEIGSNIRLWTKDNTNTSAQWYFDGLAIKMRDHQNLCIDLSQSNTGNGNNIQLWDCNGTNAQKWLYDGMTQAIRSVVNPDKCMQIEYNGESVYGKRSNVQIYDCNGSDAQQFTILE